MAKGKNVAYVRVSSAEQNEARQVEALKGFGIDKWFSEKRSGKNMDRPQLGAMLDYIREDDTVYVAEFSRLGRSMNDLLNIVNQIEEKGAKFVSVKESFDTKTPAGRLQMHLLAAIAEFERAIILERQKEGIALAKERGVYKGRKPIEVENFDDYYERYLKREISASKLARELNVSRSTIMRMIKKRRDKDDAASEYDTGGN